MPNYDAGHYFLTVLVPIRLDVVITNGMSRSRRHLIREVLSDLPTGEATAASKGTRPDAPFSRCQRTHFARFVVIDDVVFNGRVSGDSILDRLRGVFNSAAADPLVPQPVDRLSTPFLAFAADFDAEDGSDAALEGYLTGLWSIMSAELQAVLQHCVGFDKVESAAAFCRYIKRCQIETTMPFNDYWAVPPALSDLSLVPYLIGGGIGAVLLVAGFFAGWRLGLGGLAVIVLAAYLAYRAVANKAAKPFPTSAPPAAQPDLPTLLKALTMQRAFTDFAIDSQGMDDQALHQAFGQFLLLWRPDNLADATQPAGVIGV